MRLHDGELGPEEASELEGGLSPEDLRVLAGLEQIGDVVRSYEPEALDRFEGVADQVMASLDRVDNVVALGPRVEIATETLRPPRQRRTRSGPVVAIGLALAAAAAAALWMTTPGGPPPETTASMAPLLAPPPRAPVADPSSPPAATDDDADLAATIEAVDFGNRAGTIFMVPAGDQSTPVVWLVDEAPSGRMEPL
jgi:hypothetical protein